MRKKISLLRGTLVVLSLALIGCGSPSTSSSPTVGPTLSPSDQPTFKAAEGGTATCMKCHGDGTELNDQIQNARTGWLTSKHALGVIPDGETIGEGSDAFYANAGSCIRCHTKEGFNDFVDGKFNTNGKFDPLKLPDTATATVQVPVVQDPSSLTCFTCHRPHTNADMRRVVADDAAVTLLDGTTYKKPKGAICANCHQARTDKKAADAIVASLKTAAVSARSAAHHSPVASVMMGAGGAEYALKTYSSGAHKTIDGANCVACHMTYPNARFGGGPGLAGHSFNVVGLVHGAELANPAGCVSCHPSAKALVVGASGAIAAKGHLVKGDAHIAKGGDLTSASNTFAVFAAALDKLADPDNKCEGLLTKAYADASVGTAGKAFTWGDKVNCESPAFTVAADPAATDTSPKTRFAKALHNYLMLVEDRSWGAHNPQYELQLLNDSCTDLKDFTKSDVDCGARP